MITKVNICGILHEVKYVKDRFNADGQHYGQIDYGNAEILINSELSEAITNETLCHEMLHGMLIHIGEDELSSNERFVNALSNAINQAFIIKDFSDRE